MAVIRQRTLKNGTTKYQAMIRMVGKPHASATFKRKSDAKKWVSATEAEILEGRYFKQRESYKHTMSELFDRYETWPKFTGKRDQKNPLRMLKYWRVKIGDMRVADVDSVLIGDIRDELAAPEGAGKARAAATVNRYLAILSHVFTYAVKERKWADTNPCKDVARIKEPDGRDRYLSDEEREALLAACKNLDETLYLIVVLALSTGARRGEIMNLRWPDVDMKAGRAILRQTKNNETRVMPIVSHAMELLREHRKVRQLDSDLVFPHPSDPSRPWNFESLWRKSKKAAEIEDFRFHDLRHSAASYLAMDGASLAEIAEVLGHKTLAMVKRYAHLSDSHVSSVVEQMNQKIFG